MKEAEEPRQLRMRQRVLSWILVRLVGLLARSLRLTIVREAETEKALQERGGGMLVTWHGRTLVPIWRLRNRGYWALISLSRDGDIQAQNFRNLGFRVIRGSTGRRGVAATREVLHALESGGILAFTPDGPRGPAQIVQEGVVYFARRSGKPVVPTGVAASRSWQLGTWDRYLIPQPFARVIWIYGDPIYIEPHEDPATACQRIGAAIDSAQAEAVRRLA